MSAGDKNRKALRVLSRPQGPFSRVNRQLLTRFADRFHLLARTSGRPSCRARPAARLRPTHWSRPTTRLGPLGSPDQVSRPDLWRIGQVVAPDGRALPSEDSVSLATSQASRFLAVEFSATTCSSVAQSSSVVSCVDAPGYGLQTLHGLYRLSNFHRSTTLT